MGEDTVTKQPKTVAEIVADLEAAQSEYREAAFAASLARASETTALNRLNDAQEQFDAAIAQLKDRAPAGSDWKSMTREKGGA